ncbi:amidohydrolase family protein [Sphingomonas sp. 2SG]|uniref:amidohydrolase family protein n=1 Tax=Sphingomonas sp. 2SG TaxID=2502201 RepID=UPI0010F72C0C|nr:amidohydrolase family protein [Sphingomonas sp. 2SG]
MPTRREMMAGGAAILATAASASPAAAIPYRRIACEEGYLSPGLLSANAHMHIPGVPLITRDGPVADLAEQLVDVGAGRIATMDRDGIAMQLLLLSSPGVQIFPVDQACVLAREANDYVAAACRRHPTRLAALAAIAPQDPAAAAHELERGVTSLGLKGGIINSHTGGVYLDAPAFWPIFEAAEALDVPIYIHPRDPAGGMREVLAGPLTGGAAWAYGVEVGTHVLKLMQAGLFDRFPRLKIVIGHMGEGLPFWMSRLDNRWLEQRGRMAASGTPMPMKRLPSEYLRTNIWVTTSGMNDWAPLRLTQEVLGADRVLYATDYPFEKQGETVAVVERMPLSPAAKKTLFETNAVTVFKLGAQT